MKCRLHFSSMDNKHSFKQTSLDYTQDQENKIFAIKPRKQKWTNFRHFQKICKRKARKAEWNYINILSTKLRKEGARIIPKLYRNTLNQGKQYNIGVASLKK